MRRTESRSEVKNLKKAFEERRLISRRACYHAVPIIGVLRRAQNSNKRAPARRAAVNGVGLPWGAERGPLLAVRRLKRHSSVALRAPFRAQLRFVARPRVSCLCARYTSPPPPPHAGSIVVDGDQEILLTVLGEFIVNLNQIEVRACPGSFYTTGLCCYQGRHRGIIAWHRIEARAGLLPLVEAR